MTKPPLTIGVCATSTRVDPEKLAAGVVFLEQRGVRVVIHPDAYATTRGCAGGTPEVRARSFMDLMCDDTIDAVVCARGGNRCMQILDRLDYAALQGHQKPVMGFSDNTALLCAIYKHAGITGWHGPHINTFGDTRYVVDDLERAVAALRGDITSVELGGTSTSDTPVTGPLIGGNLTLFTSLLGTPYAPDMRGAILFLEDLGEDASRYDRMFENMRLAGILGDIAGIIIGQLDANPNPVESVPFELTVPEIVDEQLGGRAIPVVFTDSFGHGARLTPLPFGQTVTLHNTTLTRYPCS